MMRFGIPSVLYLRREKIKMQQKTSMETFALCDSVRTFGTGEQGIASRYSFLFLPKNLRRKLVFFNKCLYLSRAEVRASLPSHKKRSDCAYLEVGNVGNSRLIQRESIVVSTRIAWAAISILSEARYPTTSDLERGRAVPRFFYYGECNQAKHTQKRASPTNVESQ